MLTYETWQEFAASRRSTRDFLPTEIPADVLHDVLTDGLTAPSWSNTRPFMIGVAQGEKRDRLSKALVTRLGNSAELPGMGANPDFTHEIPYPVCMFESQPNLSPLGARVGGICFYSFSPPLPFRSHPPLPAIKGGGGGGSEGHTF